MDMNEHAKRLIHLAKIKIAQAEDRLFMIDIERSSSTRGASSDLFEAIMHLLAKTFDAGLQVLP